MYIRFVTQTRDCCSRVQGGIFQAALDQWYDTQTEYETWHHAELRRELDWFNEHLDAPASLFYREGRHSERSGVCWFRDSASDCIQHARYMSWLVQDLGICVQELRSPTPGTIIYADRLQVVALQDMKSLR